MQQTPRPGQQSVQGTPLASLQNPQLYQSAVISNDPFAAFNQLGLEPDQPITYSQLNEVLTRAQRPQPLNKAYVDRIWERGPSKKPFELASAINALAKEDPAFSYWWNS